MGSVGKFKDVWNGLEPRGQLATVGAGLGVVVTFFLLYSFLSKPSYAPLVTGVDPADSAQVAQALDAAGIRYRLANGGTQVDVQTGKESQAQVALAQKGLPKGGHVGFELFDKKSLGQTQFQQQVDYQRALEGEIARTLEQIDGVGAAQVQLVLPEDTLFADQSSAASASVLLTGGTALDATTVRGIAHLVAGSVKELKPDAVTITDETGSLLWPTGDGGAGVSATGKLAAQERYAAGVAGAINALLTQTLGENKAQARVHVDLNVDQTTRDSVTYAKKGTPLKSQTDLETLQSKGGGTAGAAGVASNVPSYGNSAAAGSSGNSNYKHQVDSTDFGVDKTVERTTVAPGAVNRLDVALLLDRSVPAAQVAAIQQTVAAAAGIDAKRGDTISVQRIAFAEPPKAGSPIAAGPLADPLALAKPVGIGLAALAFLFFAFRGLKRREGEALQAAEPTWLREIEQKLTVAELERGSGGARAALESPRDTVKDQVEEIIKREPDQIAAQIGQWLKE